MADFRTETRRLTVLLIAGEVPRRKNLTIVGSPDPHVSDGELTDFAELLSAYNYPFDIVSPNDVRRVLALDGGSVPYSTIIVTTPLSTLPDSAMSLIAEASHDAGVSLMATYSHADDRSARLFGIQCFKGKRFLRPLKARIVGWPGTVRREMCVANYGLTSGLSGVRRRGLRMLSWKDTFIKFFNSVGSLPLPYMRVILSTDAKILSTTMDGSPLAWSYSFGNATNYYFALHGDRFLDKYNEMHTLVRSVIEANSGCGMVSLDLDRTMALRLDDPGASKADYVDNGTLLNEHEWSELGQILTKKRVPLSVMYTPAWVDDGDARSGTLFLHNHKITDRIVGRLYESARVSYFCNDRQKTVHDHVSEFRGLEALVNKRCVDIHSHGLTHLVPRYEAWAAAENKSSDVRWYTEFVDSQNNEPVGEEAQMEAMRTSKESIESLFNTIPAAITPSGHKHDASCDIIAHAAGYKLFSSDYTAIIKDRRIVRNWKIPSIFLCFKDPSSAIAKAGYPVIGVIHDYEIKDCLDRLRILIERWSEAGIRRFMSLSNLAISLCSSIDAVYSEQHCNLTVTIGMPTAIQRRVGVVWGATPEIFVRVAFPCGLCCHEERITIDGGVLVSSEWTAHSSVSLAIKVVDQRSVKVVLPLNVCELTPDAGTRLRGDTVVGRPRHHVVGTGRV